MKQDGLQGKTAVIYARYSSHNQRDVSIEQQVNECVKFAAAQELTVLKVYDDHAMTGTTIRGQNFSACFRTAPQEASLM